MTLDRTIKFLLAFVALLLLANLFRPMIEAFSTPAQAQPPAASRTILFACKAAITGSQECSPVAVRVDNDGFLLVRVVPARQ